MNYFELDHVKKRIGEEMVLNDVTLRLDAGKVYWLRGENGAGKTMLLRLLAGMISATEGEFRYNGTPCIFGKKRSFSLGIILENMGLYDEFSLYENLRLLASVNKICGDKDISASIKRVGLDPDSKKRFGKFSMGMKKRAMIAQAVMERPEVLLLDEPGNGLDEDGRKMLYRILQEERDRGAVVVVSSHLNDDLGEMADVVIDVQEGVFQEVQKQGAGA